MIDEKCDENTENDSTQYNSNDFIETILPSRFPKVRNECGKTMFKDPHNSPKIRRKFNPRHEFLDHTYLGEIPCLSSPWVTFVDKTTAIADSKSNAADFERATNESKKELSNLPVPDHLIIVEPEIVMTRRMKRALLLAAAAKEDREVAQEKNSGGSDDKHDSSGAKSESKNDDRSDLDQKSTGSSGSKNHW